MLRCRQFCPTLAVPKVMPPCSACSDVRSLHYVAIHIRRRIALFPAVDARTCGIYELRFPLMAEQRLALPFESLIEPLISLRERPNSVAVSEERRASRRVLLPAISSRCVLPRGPTLL